VKAFLNRRPIWLTKNLGVDRMRQEAEIIEMQAANFYEKAADRVLDVNMRELLLQLAEIERRHGKKAGDSYLQQTRVRKRTRKRQPKNGCLFCNTYNLVLLD